MCDFCEMSHCPPACPAYGEEDVGSARCVLCESRLQSGERVLEQGGRLLCMDCAAGLDIDALLYLCNVDDIAELLCEHLGWEGRTVM